MLEPANKALVLTPRAGSCNYLGQRCCILHYLILPELAQYNFGVIIRHP